MGELSLAQQAEIIKTVKSSVEDTKTRAADLLTKDMKQAIAQLKESYELHELENFGWSQKVEAPITDDMCEPPDNYEGIYFKEGKLYHWFDCTESAEEVFGMHRDLRIHVATVLFPKLLNMIKASESSMLAHYESFLTK